MQGLKNELAADKVKGFWEQFRLESKYFKQFTSEEIQGFCMSVTTLKFFRGDVIVKAQEKLEWIGFVMLGEVAIYQNDAKIGILRSGDALGYMAIFSGMTHHEYTMTAMKSGYISVISLKDLIEMYTAKPIVAYKIHLALGLKALDVLSVQYLNQYFLPPIAMLWAEYPATKVQEYIDKFLDLSEASSEFFEKSEGKLLQTYIKIVHFDIAKTVVMPGQYENCIFMIAKGEMLDCTGQRYIREKEIIGFEQFFFGKPWNCHVKTSTFCDVLLMHRDVFNQNSRKSPAGAIKVYKLLTKLYLNQLSAYSRRKVPEFYIEYSPNTVETPNDPAFHFFQKPHMYKIDYLYTNESLLIKTKEPSLIFINFKILEQVEQAKLEKIAGKNRKKGQMNPAKAKQILKEALEKTESGYVNFNEELEDLIEEKEKIVAKKEKLLEKMEILKKNNEELKRKLREKKEINGVLMVKMRQNEVMKDIGNLEEIKSSMKSPFMAIVNRSFFDITSEQIKLHKANQIALKYAEKWKFYVKTRKHQRMIQEKSRFWPGE